MQPLDGKEPYLARKIARHAADERAKAGFRAHRLPVIIAGDDGCSRGGLAEGGSEGLLAFWPRRDRKSHTSASGACTRSCEGVMRASRSRHPGPLRRAMQAL